ncbi:MAG: AAA family ATPase [Prevotella sp.]|nr:AAA family ATPase [Prevotella sp.]
MMYKSHSDFENLQVRNVIGVDKKEEPRSDRERMMFSVFDDVYVNNIKLKGKYILTFEREDTSSHKNRLHICYAKYLTYKGYSNKQTLSEMATVLGCSEDACWFVSEINVKYQSQLHFTAIVVNANKSMVYSDSKTRKAAWDEMLGTQVPLFPSNKYRPFITAIKSKPFLLLAGISGTGKSRIVRELARACWEEGSEEYKAQKPRNFEMVQVKPNWHDSSELIGYVSRVSGQAEYVAGDFLRFIARAWAEKDVPYFLCLDEMNLAPVEQYFAEYLSVVESRKNIGGVVVTDPIVPAAKMRGPGGVLIPNIWYSKLIDELLSDCPKDKELELKSQFTNDGICLPQNLIVVGTVNMDETTFSFSRKVLDRAMTIEMNEVNLKGGLRKRHEEIGRLGAAELIGTAVEGVDVFEAYHDVCKTTINYLQAVNDKLEGTPFKIAYRTRNEFLLYVVNNLPYKQENETQEHVITRALDEITSMKILSRIEGDETKVSREFLEELKKVVAEGLNHVSGEEYTSKKDEDGKTYSVSLAKLEEMKDRLKSGYTSFWN